MKKIYLLLIFCCLSIAGFAVCVTPPTAISGPTSVCAGNSINLTDGVAGGVWSSTNGSGSGTVGSTSGIVNGISAGTITISYTTAGCTPATYVVMVNAYPNAITGPATVVCVGGTLSLTDVTTGGVWGSTFTTTATVDPTGVVTGNGAGPVTISYNVAGCAVTYPITVNPVPLAVTGPSSVCIGHTILLSDLSPGGTWSSSTPGVASVGSNTGIVTGVASGATYITYTYTATGCYAAAILENVNTNPASISGAMSVCEGYTTTLSDISGGGTWSSSNPPIASIGSSTGVVTGGSSTGTTTITYMYIATSCFITQTMSVNANPAIINGSALVCVGNTITLSDLTPGGSWSSAEFWVASVGSTGVVTGITGGATSTISYTIANGCFTTYIDSVVTPPSMITGDTTLCVGYTTTFLDSVSGGTWSSSAPGSAYFASPSAGVITATAPGVVTVTYSVTMCPSVSHNVTVNPVPATITGASSLCDSVHSYLYDLTPGGLWTSSDSTHARVVSYPDTGVAVGVSLGTAVISYTMPTGCFVVLPVTVNPLAPPIAGSDTICSTGSTWLTDIVGGGTWTSSNMAVATITIDSGKMTGIVPGLTYIVYTLPTGCTASLLVDAIPAIPPISSPSHVCTGSVINMTDPDTTGVWSSANNYIASVGTNGVLSGHFPDTVNITYTTSAFKGCYATKTIVVNPLPVPVITRTPGTRNLVTFNYYTSYQWFNDRTGLIAGATTPTYVLPFASDSFYVVVTDTNGCTARGSWYPYDFTGVNNVSAENINVYPNPASSTLYIEGTVQVRAVLSTIDGRMIMAEDHAKELNISSLAPGMYLLALYNDNGEMIKMEKVIKE